MADYNEYKEVIESFNTEVLNWFKENTLSSLPEYHKLNNKNILGTCFRNDQLYFEKLADFKSTYFGLSAFLTKELSKADRESKRSIELLIDSINIKIKEVDTRVEAGRKRLDFYKTVVYMIGNVIYGAD